MFHKAFSKTRNTSEFKEARPSFSYLSQIILIGDSAQSNSWPRLSSGHLQHNLSNLPFMGFQQLSPSHLTLCFEPWRNREPKRQRQTTIDLPLHFQFLYLSHPAVRPQEVRTDTTPMVRQRRECWLNNTRCISSQLWTGTELKSPTYGVQSRTYRELNK